MRLWGPLLVKPSHMRRDCSTLINNMVPLPSIVSYARWPSINPIVHNCLESLVQPVPWLPKQCSNQQNKFQTKMWGFVWFVLLLGLWYFFKLRKSRIWISLAKLPWCFGWAAGVCSDPNAYKSYNLRMALVCHFNNIFVSKEEQLTIHQWKVFGDSCCLVFGWLVDRNKISSTSTSPRLAEDAPLCLEEWLLHSTAPEWRSPILFPKHFSHK